jgi:hypothetical protein
MSLSNAFKPFLAMAIFPSSLFHFGDASLSSPDNRPHAVTVLGRSASCQLVV